MKPSSLRPPQRTLAGALQEDRGDLFFTVSVENREPPLCRALSTLDSDEHERYHCCYLQQRRSHPGRHCTGYVRQAIHLRHGCSWKEYTLSRNPSPWYSLSYLLVVVVLILLII